MGRNQCKKAENTRNQNASPPTGDRSSASAREQGLTEDECDELTESGFRSHKLRIRIQEFKTSPDNLIKPYSVTQAGVQWHNPNSLHPLPPGL
ncbi:hypothetical protein AAY473_024895, partial [Plecturocebus cupreus]